MTDTTSLRVNFGRNFRVPTLADLFFTPFNNPNLRPESGWSFDVGVDQQLGDRGLARLTFSATISAMPSTLTSPPSHPKTLVGCRRWA